MNIHTERAEALQKRKENDFKYLRHYVSDIKKHYVFGRKSIVIVANFREQELILRALRYSGIELERASIRGFRFI